MFPPSRRLQRLDLWLLGAYGINEVVIGPRMNGFLGPALARDIDGPGYGFGVDSKALTCCL